MTNFRLFKVSLLIVNLGEEIRVSYQSVFCRLQTSRDPLFPDF